MAEASSGTRTDWIAFAGTMPAPIRTSASTIRRQKLRATKTDIVLRSGAIAPANPQGKRVRLQKCIEEMILPETVDPQISAGQPLLFESISLQQFYRCLIVWQASGLDPVQPQTREGKPHHCANRTRHQPFSCEGQAHPIAKRRRLGDAALDLAERQAADQNIIAFAEDQEGIGLVFRNLLRMPAKPAAERCAGQVVARPCRLPW